MRSDDIFIGNIRRCVAYIGESFVDGSSCFNGTEIDSEIYKSNAILYRTRNGRYVDIDNIKTFIDNWIIKKCENNNTLGLLMPTYAYGEDSLYVDKKSLKPFSNPNDKSDISIKSLKKYYTNL